MISLNKDMPIFPGRAGVSERRPIHDPSALGVEEWTFEPGVTFSGHAHDVDQIAYIIKGRLKLKQGKNEFELEPGCYYFTPAGSVHQITEIIETTTMLIVSNVK
ncbi:MAG: cupin domain-containing protein [Chloroflexota bacterium]